MLDFDINNYTYTPLFCEENIWKLIKALYMNKNTKPKDVLFIVNKSQSIALYEQKRSIDQQPVIWDYHVILTAQQGSVNVVFDFDSKCNFPVNIKDYFSKTFPKFDNMYETYRPMIKAINAQYFFKHFFSDRSHMKGLIDNDQYPDYEIIRPNSDTDLLTLDNCLDVTRLNKQLILYNPYEYLKLNK